MFAKPVLYLKVNTIIVTRTERLRQESPSQPTGVLIGVHDRAHCSISRHDRQGSGSTENYLGQRGHCVEELGAG